MADSVRVQGLAGDAYTRFRNGTDFDVDAAGTIVWGAPPDAALPGRRQLLLRQLRADARPAAPPRLTDRNPGSVLRTLAESFAREYAVMSRQLEQVYDASFLDTAEGRDLDSLVALVGIERRTQLFAVGEVVFSRTTPAPGDIAIEEGTTISTSDLPSVTVASTEARTLRSGGLSVSVPVRSTVSGPDGAAAAGTLTVLHRPILGITDVRNVEPLVFRGDAETDLELRRRASHALEGAGRSTPGAIVGALLGVEGIREQDIQIVEDHVAFPGVVKVTVAAELDDAHARQAVELLNEARPAGVRILHNLPVPPAVAAPASPGGGAEPGPPPPAGLTTDVFSFVAVTAAVVPASSQLTAVQRDALIRDVEDAIGAYVDSRGVGAQVVYNQLVAAVMAVDGVYDVVVDLFPQGAPPTGRQNLSPEPNTRPKLGDGALDVTLRGALIALDVTVAVERKGLAATTDAATALDVIRTDVANRLNALLPTLAQAIRPDVLLGQLSDTDTYAVDQLSYTAEFLDEGLRILSPNKEIEPAADQVPWVRSVAVTDSEQVT